MNDIMNILTDGLGKQAESYWYLEILKDWSHTISIGNHIVLSAIWKKKCMAIGKLLLEAKPSAI